MAGQRPTDGAALAQVHFAAGADQVIFADKVMCLRNDHKRKRWDPAAREPKPGGVANGEIGMIVAGPESHRTVTGSSSPPTPLLSPELLYTALTRQQDKVLLLKRGDQSTLRAFASPSRSETARRLTCLFRPADPFGLGDVVVDGAHVHRTALGDDLGRSKSEVIVADALNDLGLVYAYEQELTFPGEFPRRPDLTIPRPGTTPVYWEHLGMLDLAGYRADGETRKAWYASHDILPWSDGGGSNGALVWSDENLGATGIDSNAIRELAQEVFSQ